jgi:sensor histidine kinase regulating citrate/malate metabolism
MNSIRARLLLALIILVAFVSVLAAVVTYRRVLSETSTLFDYQLRQMALSLRSQISLAPRIEVPPDQGDTDFVVQIWDIFGARTYL